MIFGKLYVTKSIFSIIFNKLHMIIFLFFCQSQVFSCHVILYLTTTSLPLRSSDDRGNCENGHLKLARRSSYLSVGAG
jgi:hypothetical protein